MKEEHKTGYKILLSILKPIYLFYYRPTIINKENIPKEGPIIICCNHIHLFDQNNILISTKRMIHYMAKKEHLDGKFGWFFRAVGCIRVDRDIHDDNAKEKAISLLNNGYAVGIFPEGTRNQVFGKKDINLKLYELYKDKYSYKKFIKILKKNQVKISELNLLDKLLEEGRIDKKDYVNNALNISDYLKELLSKNIISKEEYNDSIFLPFKYGAVSMAMKTNSKIVPCVIKGKYKFWNNKLTITFGKPIEINQNGDIEKYNKILRETMLEEYKNND